MTDIPHDIDLHRLDQYLSAKLPSFQRLKNLEKFSDGQSNPTYLLTADSGKYVLRRQPFGEILKSAHAVDREFRVLSALEQSQIPVPRTLHLCQDPEVVGSQFYIMSYVPGRVFWNPALPELNLSQRGAIYDEMNRVLSALHDVNIFDAGLSTFGKPGDYFARQISRWTRQYRASETESIAAMDKLIEWLPSNTPADNGLSSLIHGDYRIDNIIFDSVQPRANAVLDWELSTLGHPYADLAYQCMQWRIDNECVIPGLGNLDRKALGIPTEQEYIDRYCERRGLDSIQNWDFYLAFSFFRLAAILQGVYKRALDGNASSGKALEHGALAPKLASTALKILD